jgi:hypothetical protein
MAKERAENEYEKFSLNRIMRHDDKGSDFDRAIEQLPPKKRGKDK